MRVTVAGQVLQIRRMINDDGKLTISLAMETIVQAGQKLEINISMVQPSPVAEEKEVSGVMEIVN
jgi:hypothetical protein